MLRLLGCELHVQPQLLFQIGVASDALQRSPKTSDPFAERTHVRFPACYALPRSTVWMMAAIWSHARIFSASWRRPAAVSA